VNTFREFITYRYLSGGRWPKNSIHCFRLLLVRYLKQRHLVIIMTCRMCCYELLVSLLRMNRFVESQLLGDMLLEDVLGKQDPLCGGVAPFDSRLTRSSRRVVCELHLDDVVLTQHLLSCGACLVEATCRSLWYGIQPTYERLKKTPTSEDISPQISFLPSRSLTDQLSRYLLCVQNWFPTS